MIENDSDDLVPVILFVMAAFMLCLVLANGCQIACTVRDQVSDAGAPSCGER